MFPYIYIVPYFDWIVELNFKVWGLSHPDITPFISNTPRSQVKLTSTLLELMIEKTPYMLFDPYRSEMITPWYCGISLLQKLSNPILTFTYSAPNNKPAVTFNS
jgi:hypothetical protein